ncbi:MAG TPA: gluconokinase [Terriglobales bacterium]
MVIFLMGVTGSGKTTVGQALAESLHWQFIDADDFHPPSNVAKMRAGIPLDDADRAPWLAALRTHIVGWLNSEANVVLACSALKQAYRDELVVSPDVRVVYLRGSSELITARLKERHGHYMDPNLLSSQFATLEEPRDTLVVDVDTSVDEIVKQIRKGVGVPR